MRKLFTAAMAVIIICICAGCEDYTKIEGYELMVGAQDIYEALNSAHITVTDKNSGLVTQDFIFKYEGETLTYSYAGTDGDTVYYENHNGSRIEYTYADTDEWRIIEAADENYFQYTKTSRHPLASRQLLEISEEAISASSVKEGDNGSKIVSFDYDIDKLKPRNDDAFSRTGKEELTYFHIEAVLNQNGECTSFTQRAKLINDGVIKEEEYEVLISEMNSVEIADTVYSSQNTGE